MRTLPISSRQAAIQAATKAKLDAEIKAAAAAAAAKAKLDAEIKAAAAAAAAAAKAKIDAEIKAVAMAKAAAAKPPPMQINVIASPPKKITALSYAIYPISPKLLNRI